MRSKIITTLLMLGASLPTYSWKMGDVFDGMSTNITKPGSYHDQAAGHYSGGGFSMRNKRSTFEPFKFTEPKLKMGCSGIDMYAGSFSVFKGSELVKLAKNLGAQAQSYGFQLALKTFAPQIEQLLSKLRDLAMELNQFSVEECQMVQSLYASVAPKDSRMYEQVCQDLSRTGGGKDYFDARDDCKKDAAAKAKAKQVNRDNPSLTIIDYNLFIKAAEQIGIPPDLHEPTMSMVGTIINNNGQVTPYESLVHDDATWNAHVKGGEGASIYQCVGGVSNCLAINVLNKQTIRAENSYQAKAAKKLEELRKKFQDNTAFDDADINFLSSIGETFPIYDYISFEAVSGEHLIDKSSDLVATYMILQYVKKITQEVKAALHVLSPEQLNDQHIKDYIASLDKVQQLAAEKYQLLMGVARNLEKRARHLESHQLAKMRG